MLELTFDYEKCYDVNKNHRVIDQTLYIRSTTTIPTRPSMPPAAKALLAPLGFAERGVEVALMLALGALTMGALAVGALAVGALAVVKVLSEDGTVIELVGSRMVLLWAAPELATVKLGVALVDRVELLLLVRRALDEEEMLDIDAVAVVALADVVEIEMEETGRLMDTDEVGT